jgi:hypothetical protein
MGDLGTYFASSGAITGSAGAQNLLSIENPSASGVILLINRASIQGILTALSGLVFTYSMSRTTAIPSGGTVITSVKRRALDATAQGIVRVGPTATAVAGVFASFTPGVVLGITLSGTSAPVPIEFNSGDDNSAIVLDEGEGIVIQAGANLVTWSHFVSIQWEENRLV